MPTLREIADACGTTKQTVTTRLKELGLWDAHVAKDGRTFDVDAFAASAVADALKDAHSASDGAGKTGGGKGNGDASLVALGALRDALSASQEQSRTLARELDEKNAQIRSLMDELAAARATIDRLSSRSWLDRFLGRGLPPAGGTS